MVTCDRICIASVLISSLMICAVAVGEPAGVPLPDVCHGPRGDRTISSDIPRKCRDVDRVHRFFFQENENKYCKKYSLCQALATFMDELADPTKNYFQDLAGCEQACTNVVQCLREPLQLANGSPGIESEEGVWSELSADQQLGLGTTITFRCHNGYGLADGIWNRTCILNGTWSGSTPTCNIQCPKPKRAGYTVSPLSNYYSVGERIQLDCMDGHVGSTQLTCLHNGSWAGDFPTCSPGCSPPPADKAHPPVAETVGDITYYTYTCHDGYALLNDSDNCTLSRENYTLSCVNGTMQGRAPECTRIQIRTGYYDRDELSLSNGTYHLKTEIGRGANNRVLTCGLEGLSHDYQVDWVPPKKPNGEIPPEVEISDFRLFFHRVLTVQSGEYICNICDATTRVVVNIREAPDPLQRPPSVYYFHPNGTFKAPAGEEIQILTLTRGALPLQVVWQHNGSNISSDSQYDLIEFVDTEREIVLSTLVVRDVRELSQGVYKIVANNSGGRIVSPETVMLMLANEDETISRRSVRSTGSDFCKEDPRKVILTGVVRRTSQTESGMTSIRLKVDRVLRGDSSGGITEGHKIEVRIFSNHDTRQLVRGQKFIFSGVQVERVLYVLDTPVEQYSAEAEREMASC